MVVVVVLELVVEVSEVELVVESSSEVEVVVDVVAAAGDARRVGRIGAGVELVAVEEAVLVAVDADARARARRHAGVGQLLARRVAASARSAASVSGGSAPRSLWKVPPPTYAASRAARRRRVPFTTRSHSPASARAIEQVDARPDRRAVRARAA